MSKLLYFFKWMFPIRYRYHAWRSGDHKMGRFEWEQFIKDCDYTVWNDIKLEFKWLREDPIKFVKGWIRDLT